jgi:hypothetical protein
MRVNDALVQLLDELLEELPAADATADEEHARRELAALPVALRAQGDSFATRRGELQRVAAIRAAANRRPQELVAILRRDFLDGGSARPLVRLLIGSDEAAVAAIFCRLALARQSCRDRRAIEDLLASTGQPPDGWSDALVRFAGAPSVEAWDELHRFTPSDVYYDRVRHALHVLDQLGVDPEILFHCATRDGTTPDAIALVESGRVSPETVAARGEGSPAVAMWQALAAVAAAARNDRLAVVRYLRAAWRCPDSTGLVEALTLDIRRAADAEVLDLLDSSGVP